MRSADTLPRLLAAATIVALCGCSTIGDALKAIQDTVVTPVAKRDHADAGCAAASAAAPRACARQGRGTGAAGRAAHLRRRAARDARRPHRRCRARLQGAGAINPELGGPHANLGLIYRQAGKLPESAAALERAVKASPEQPVYFNQLGITYRHQGQFAKARAAYERAIELDAELRGARS